MRLYHSFFELSAVPPDWQVLSAAWPPLCVPHTSNTCLTFCQVTENSLSILFSSIEQSHLKYSFKGDLYRKQRRRTVTVITMWSEVGFLVFSNTDKTHLSSHKDQQPLLCRLSHPLECCSPHPPCQATVQVCVISYWGGQLAQKGSLYLHLAARCHWCIYINLCYLSKTDRRLRGKEPKTL